MTQTHEIMNPQRLQDAARQGMKVDGSMLLPVDEEEFTPHELALLLSKNPSTIRRHAARLFGPRSRYVLNRREAIRLCSWVLKFGRF